MHGHLNVKLLYMYIYVCTYVYAPALEPAAATVFVVWLRAWLRVHVMRFGGKKMLIKIRKVPLRGWWASVETVRFNDQKDALFL